MKTKSKLEEKKLSKAELEAREKVIKDLKKNKSALVKRYGKDAEAVMYGRATNIAKKMAESENKNRIKELVRKALMQEADIEVMADKYGEEKALGQAAIMLDALESLLKKHDWWYMMSDDNRAYTQGSAQQYEIRKIMKELEDIGYGDDAKELFNKYAPDGPGGTSLKMKENMDVATEMSTQETSGHAERFAKYMSDKEGKTFTVTAGSVEGPSFDLDLNGVKYDGGSYVISKNGDIVNMALPENPVYANISMLEGKKEDMDKDGDIDSKDYLLKRDAAIKKAKGELKEDWGSSDQSIMNQSIHRDLGNPTEFPSPFDDKFESAVESAVDFYWDEFPEYKTDREGLINQAKKLYYRRYFPEKFEGFMKMFSENIKEAEKPRMFVTGGSINPELVKKVEQFVKGVAKYYDYSVDDAYFAIMSILKGGIAKENVNEDIDLGHEDNEPHMLKGDLYRIGKYAMELYAMAEELEETGEEIDFPAWWQSMITDAASKMVKAKHYLDFELKEPAIDAAVDAATGEEPHMGEPMMEDKVEEVDTLAAKIAKALKDKANQSPEDQNNIKQARKAMNDDKIDTAKKIIKPYLSEKIAKQLKSK
jgi:hypothetical protein